MTGMHMPGFEVLQRLGSGPRGEVWAARELATGDTVALKRVDGLSDLAARDRLRREVAVLSGFTHPHVLRLRRVLGDGDAMVLVLDLANGGSLAGLMSVRGPLSPGEVVTLAVPLAQALAAVHAHGLVHGAVGPANVLFTADGRPMLSDLGLPRLLGGRSPGANQGPADDVYGLAVACVTALTGAPPEDRASRQESATRRTQRTRDEAALLDVLEPALDVDPSRRPGAAELAGAAFDAVTAQPLCFPGRAQWQADASLRPSKPSASPAPAVGPGRHRAHTPRPGSPRRRGLAALLGAAALTLAAMTGITWAGADAGPPAADVRQVVARSDPPPGRPSTSTSLSAAPSSLAAAPSSGAAAPAGWAATLARLDDRRARAFAAGDPDLLAGVYATASAAGERDAAKLQRLLDAGLRAEGLRLRATSVVERERTGSEARLIVTDTMGPYRLVDERGHPAQRRPGRGPLTWLVTLRNDRGIWLIDDVVSR